MWGKLWGKKKKRLGSLFLLDNLAERTGLEPATLGVTGRYSNQLNYRSKLQRVLLMSLTTTTSQNLWRPQGDSNPRTHRERVMS